MYPPYTLHKWSVNSLEMNTVGFILHHVGPVWYHAFGVGYIWGPYLLQFTKDQHNTYGFRKYNVTSYHGVNDEIKMSIDAAITQNYP